MDFTYYMHDKHFKQPDDMKAGISSCHCSAVDELIDFSSQTSVYVTRATSFMLLCQKYRKSPPMSSNHALPPVCRCLSCFWSTLSSWRTGRQNITAPSCYSTSPAHSVYTDVDSAVLLLLLSAQWKEHFVLATFRKTGGAQQFCLDEAVHKEVHSYLQQ